MPHSSDSGKGSTAASNRRRPIALSWDQSDPDTAMRRTGISLMAEAPWGTHLCLFYETKQDLIDSLVPYFKAALESKEFCIWAVSPPITEEDAAIALRRSYADFDRHLVAGSIEIVPGHEWYPKGSQFDPNRIVDGWHDKLNTALTKGYEGLRASGNAFWQLTDRWQQFCEYERALDILVSAQRMIVLCTYALDKSRPHDVFDVARAHQCTIAKRRGDWEFLEVPGAKQAKKEIKLLNGDLDVLSKTFPGRELLTPRECVVLAQIVKGASSKEVARTLRISPRTVEYHRASMLRKLDAKNTVDLVRLVLGEG
jgi:DNA-binding CsgD family transcriptional regulator